MERWCLATPWVVLKKGYARPPTHWQRRAQQSRLPRLDVILCKGAYIQQRIARTLCLLVVSDAFVRHSAASRRLGRMLVRVQPTSGKAFAVVRGDVERYRIRRRWTGMLSIPTLEGALVGSAASCHSQLPVSQDSEFSSGTAVPCPTTDPIARVLGRGCRSRSREASNIWRAGQRARQTPAPSTTGNPGYAHLVPAEPGSSGEDVPPRQKPSQTLPEFVPLLVPLDQRLTDSSSQTGARPRKQGWPLLPEFVLPLVPLRERSSGPGATN